MTNMDRIAEIRKRAENAKDIGLTGAHMAAAVFDAYCDDIPYLLSQLAERDKEIERLREAQRWIDGSPSGFGGERTWVIAKIPSLFLPGAFGYKAYLWNGDGGWNDREVLRAMRWCLMPLPVAPAETEGDCP